jgi:hypothetical protein
VARVERAVPGRPSAFLAPLAGQRALLFGHRQISFHQAALVGVRAEARLVAGLAEAWAVLV